MAWPLCHIFALTAEEMAQIAALNRSVRCRASAPELPERYAQMSPPVDEQE
ncbi:MAG: hypothetical protein ACI4O7_05320 [Aristaeellaceae bacterium]